MNRPIQIRPLSEHEAAELTDITKFNTLRPTLCKNCGNTHDFGRQIFWIGGVSKAEQNSDSTQGLIAYHMKQRHGVDSVFFKTHRKDFYVDSAVCKRCASTFIQFDIEFTDEVLAKMARLTGRPIEMVRSELEAIAKKIVQDDRHA